MREPLGAGAIAHTPAAAKLARTILATAKVTILVAFTPSFTDGLPRMGTGCSTPEDVDASETQYRRATFHFVRI